jgi:ABC-type dipeptide/oligopeptide/nickel transport system ATPase component
MDAPTPGLILIRPGQKVLIMGQNGSGKSVLASAIARGFDRGTVLVYDPKDDPEAMIPGSTVAATAREAMRALPGRVIYRPTSPEMAHIERFWDELCRKLVDLARRGGGSSAVIVHELGDLGTPYRIGPGFAEVIRKGRSLGITLVMVTQRPQGIPVIARSEAQHVACFTLTDAADRDVAASLLSDVQCPEAAAVIRLRPLPLDHRWWYRGPDFRLRLHQPLPYQDATS